MLYVYVSPLGFVGTMQWATPIAAFILGMICFGIDEIGVELEDPLGNDRNDMEMWEVIKRLDKELALLCVMNPGTDEPFDLRTFFRSLFNLLFVVKDDFYLFLFSFLSLFYPPTWSAPSSLLRSLTIYLSLRSAYSNALFNLSLAPLSSLLS